MAIPPIAEYKIPIYKPVNRVTWQINPKRSALLIHDMQRYFVNPLPSVLRDVILQNIDALHQAARDAHMPIIFTGQPALQGIEERGLNLDFWGPGMTQTDEADIITLTSPSSDDKVVMKRRYSAFHGTDIANFLSKQNRDQLLVCGLYARLGCLITAQHAYMHDIQSFLISDAIADFNYDNHVESLELMATSCGTTVNTATAVEIITRQS